VVDAPIYSFADRELFVIYVVYGCWGRPMGVWGYNYMYVGVGSFHK
jgi:hypothetical protein